MDYQKLCMRCMREKAAAEDVCPYCGRNPSDYQRRSHMLPPFTVLNGKYLVGEVLGAGGFGITYIALDMLLERTVAIKEFYLQGSMHRDSRVTSVVTAAGNDPYHENLIKVTRAKFEEEAKTLAKLEKLPGIVYVIGYFVENETAYIVLEFLDGETLKEYVQKKGGRIPFKEVREKLLPVMDSLTILHEKGILHRDISPDNIMVLRDGGMKLYDFGGAKKFSEGDDHRSVLVMKKAGYTPIEQYSNQEFGPWTDEYALAATMYYCITGNPPVEAIRRSYEEDCLEKPSAVMADISPREEAVLLKAMSIRPSRRYPGIPEFKKALLDAGRQNSGSRAEEKRSSGPESAGKATKSGSGSDIPEKKTEKKAAPAEGSVKKSAAASGSEKQGKNGTGGSDAGSRPREAVITPPPASQQKKKPAWPWVIFLAVVGAVFSASLIGSGFGGLLRPSHSTGTSGTGASVTSSPTPAAARKPSVTPTPTQVPVKDKDMSQYDTGTQYTDTEVVKLVQLILTDWGFGNLTADGKAGSMTGEKILEYQKDRGLTENGFINEQFLASLGVREMIDPDSGSLKSGNAESAIGQFRKETEKISDTETIRQAQKDLIAQGYDCGKTDGDIGETTRKVLLRYQRNHDLAECGYVNRQLLTALKAGKGTAAPTAEQDTRTADAADAPADNLPAEAVSWKEAEAAGIKDHVMKWKDPAIEGFFRKETGISSGNVKLSDIWETDDIFLFIFADDERIKSLEDLSELRNLTAVHLRGCSEDRELDLTPLENHPLLWSLSVDGRVRDLSPLASCGNLGSLRIPAGEVSDFSPLSSLSRLAYLDLSGLNAAGSLAAMADCVSDTGRINTLHLTDCAVDSNVLKRFPGLRSLEIENCRFGQAGFDNIAEAAAGMEKLHTLHMTGCGVREIGKLKELEGLQNLDLSDNEISDLSVLKDLTHIRYLYLKNNQIEDISPLKNLKELSTLNVSGNKIKDISALKDLKTLKNATLSENQISDISALKNLELLESVALRDNPVTDFSPVNGVKHVYK